MPAVDLNRVPSFYHNYISKVQETSLQEAFINHRKEAGPVLESLPVDKWEYSYAPGKWTIKELVQHIIDAERIFSYRALSFARGDKNELPGFDENEYAIHSNANKRTPAEMINEMRLVQESSEILFNSFNEQQLENEGRANGKNIYVKAIGYIIVGHARHHLAILRERYL
jgi:hypothetical protein